MKLTLEEEEIRQAIALALTGKDSERLDRPRHAVIQLGSAAGPGSLYPEKS